MPQRPGRKQQNYTQTYCIIIRGLLRAVGRDADETTFSATGSVRSQPKQPPVTPRPPGGRGGPGHTESRDLNTTTLYQTTPYTARVKRVVALSSLVRRCAENTLPGGSVIDEHLTGLYSEHTLRFLSLTHPYIQWHESQYCITCRVFCRWCITMHSRATVL